MAESARAARTSEANLPLHRAVMIVILAAFFFSGVGALIYQVVWMRMLILTLGSTVFAVSTVITVFMGGLALGSYVVGRYVDRRFTRRELLRLYALVEVLVGLYCLLTPWLFFHLDAVYGQIYRLADLSFYFFSFIRFAFSALILILPTALMGATLPVLSRLYTEAEPVVGRRVGLLYGLNTLGGVCGVLGAAFWLLPSVGVDGSLYVGVAINFAIAASAYAAWRGMRGAAARAPAAPEPAAGLRPQGPPAAVGGRQAYLVMGAVAVAGFAALAYEVVWFRLLSMTIGSTVYAFAVMLGMFLLGIALGSHLAAPILDRIRRRALAFALLQLSIGASVLLLTPLFGRLPLVFLGFLQYFGFDFWAFQAVNVITAMVAVFLPTLLMGASFPLAIRLITRDTGALGRNVGAVYCLNTLGGVVGSFLAGFVMIPVLGMQSSLILLASINLATGCTVLFLVAGARRRAVTASAAVAALLLVAVVFYPPWNRQLLSSGVYFNTSRLIQPYAEGDLEAMLAEEQDLVYYNEGVTGTVTVSSSALGLSLAINGKVTAGVPGNTFTLVRLAGIPLMLHPQAREAMLLGLGSGTALGAMEQFDLDRIDVLEISPEVVGALDVFARYYGYNPLSDDRVRLVVNDGRAHLTHSDATYDVIVSAPPLPLMTGVANLFTREFYQRASSSLNPGGILCQWIPSYGLHVEDLKTMIRTFQSVFPQTSLWQYDAENIIFVGSTEPVTLDIERIRRQLAGTEAGSMLKRTFVGSAEAFVGGYMMGPAALRRFAGEGPLNTDRHPRLEFAVPHNLFDSTVVSNYNRMARAHPVARPRVKTGRRDGGIYYPALRLIERADGQWSRGYSGFRIRNREISPGASRPMISKRMEPVARWRNGRYRMVVTGHPEDARRVDSAHVDEHLEVHMGSTAGVRVAGGRRGPAERPLLWSVFRRDGQRMVKFTWHCPGSAMTYIGELSPASDSHGEAAEMVLGFTRGLECAGGGASDARGTMSH